MRGKTVKGTLLVVLAFFVLPTGGSASVTNTRITSGPTGTIDTRSVTFTFDSPLDGGFQCRLDSTDPGDWIPCTSPQSYTSLADGPHRFEVRALNRPGHPDPTPSVASFTVETEPPETTLAEAPSGTIDASSASFAFTSSEPGTFECRLDSTDPGDWLPCTSPQSYPSLAEGLHTFEVRAVNEVGDADPTPASASFTVDTTPPEATISAVPSVTIDTGPPRPVAGESVNLELVEGTVELQCPGEDEYSRLTSFKQVPLGCLINTRHGVVDLTASKGSSGELQEAHFWGGVFVVSQEHGDDKAVELKLAGRRMCERRGSTRKRTATVSRARRGSGGRKVWGSGKGNYETNGSYGSATVRGTTWLVVDRCDASTLFKVAEGIVSVRDFVKEKSFTLTAGQQYIAKAALPRLKPNLWP
ncbi:MAG TPA: hypothetical protein VIS51_06415 [Solirubrobacterales bacterium]